MLASPYMRLFQEIKRNVHDRKGVEFLAPDMTMLFAYFAQHHPGVRVPRIVVQMFGDTGVQTVSLSGHSPLRSDLCGALEKVARPYAIRIADVSDADSVSVSFDKRGTIWWYLRDQGQFGRILNLIHLVDDTGAFASTSRWPTLPADDE